MFNTNIELILKTLNSNLSYLFNKNTFYNKHFTKCLNLLNYLYHQDIHSNSNFTELDLNNEIFTKSIFIANSNLIIDLHFNITQLTQDYDNKPFNPDTSPILSGRLDNLFKKYLIEYTPTPTFSNHHIYSNRVIFATQFVSDYAYLLIIDGNHRLTAKFAKYKDCYIKIVYIQPEHIINYMPSKFEQCFFLLLFEIHNFTVTNVHNLNNSLIYKNFTNEYNLF